MSTTTPYGIRRAVNELQAILAAQWPNGMLPQIRFVPGQGGYRPDADDWGVPPARLGAGSVRTSGITQPPIMGLCAELVFAKCNPQDQAAYAAVWEPKAPPGGTGLGGLRP